MKKLITFIYCTVLPRTSTKIKIIKTIKITKKVINLCGYIKNVIFVNYYFYD